MAKNTLTYIDHFHGKPQSSSWEALGAGIRLADESGGQAAALIIGDGLEALAEEAAAYGAERVYMVQDPLLKDFRPEPLADALREAAEKIQPDIFLFPTTTRGRTLAGMAAVDLETGVMVDVVDLEWSADRLTAVRPIYAGKLLCKLVCDSKPEIVTLRARAFPRPEPAADRRGEIIPLEVEGDADQYSTEVVEIREKEIGVSLTEASVVVSGGRGTANNPGTPPQDLDQEEAEIWKAEQGFQLLAELAKVLQAAVGASRAAVDAGYINYDHQVGQTGKVVSPDLYIAAGISGAIQHLAGMRNSKVIVAINKDPDAPIFNLARFGVVGDLYEIVPPLTENLRKELAD